MVVISGGEAVCWREQPSVHGDISKGRS